MSRLSRFRKAPVPKLSKASIKSEDPQSDSGDDDDFVKRTIKVNPMPIKGLSQSQSKSSSSNSKNAEESISSYFSNVGETANDEVKQVPKDNKKLNIDRRKKELAKNAGEPPCSSGSKSSTKTTQETTEGPFSSDSVEAGSSTDAVDGQSKTKCPFCYKDLPNKLVGTTHIKSCAKHLSTEQIIKAMELYERQIEEWKELGISHPAHAAPSTANKKAAPKSKKNPSGKGKGGTRRQKNDDDGGADPDIELALALSVSLHEEVESRQKKNKEALLLLGSEGGESEIQRGVLNPSSSSHSSDRNYHIEKKPPPLPRPSTSKTLQAPAPVVRRRGKKIQLNILPLYTVSESEKKARVARKVSRILEEAEADKHEKFYIREEGLVEKLGVPKRLQQYQNKECTLWNMAQAGSDMPNESFKVLDFSECSVIEQEKLPDGPDDECESKNEAETHSLLPPTSASCSEAIREQRIQNEPESVKITETEVFEPKKMARKRQTSAYPPEQALKNLSPAIRDIALLLYERVDCDLLIYGREEKRIRCHKLIVTARCPLLLKDLIVETKNGQKRNVIPLTDYAHETVHAFIWYLYTGKIFSQDEKLLQELKDIGKDYGVDVDDGETEDHRAVQKSSKEVSTQTTPSITPESSTSKDTMTGTGTVKESCGDVNQGTQELFTSIIDDNSSTALTVVSPCASPKEPAREPIPSPENKAMWNCSKIDDDQCSACDLFEEFDAEEQQRDVDDKDEFDKLCMTQNSFRHVDENEIQDAHENEPEVGNEPITFLDYDNGIDLDDIRSPDVSQQDSTGSERKRSRSPSFFEFNYERSSQLFSATQAAYIMKREEKPESMDAQLGQNSESDHVIVRSNKKQKLDTNVLAVDSGFNSEDIRRSSPLASNKMDVDLNEDNFGICSGEDSLLLKAVSEFENSYSSNAKAVCVDLATPTPAVVARTRLTRSGSTPNLSSPVASSSNRLSFSQKNNYNQSSAFDDDPFAGDNTLFANLNIPELPEKISPVLCVGKSNVVSIDVGTPPTRVAKRLSPRNLSLEEEQHRFEVETQPKGGKRGKGRQNDKKETKSKAAPKLKLPTKVPAASQDSGPTNRNLSQPSSKPSGPTQNSNASPLLNYSLIDTPILKQELKKYGIKPLPRSKAKVLLRHIYHETHK